MIVVPPLTPVMARLDRTDLETLDALIAAGCVPNRADAIRWALARVRERPAYKRLVEGATRLQAMPGSARLGRPTRRGRAERAAGVCPTPRSRGSRAVRVRR